MRVGGALPLSFCGDAPNHEALAAALNVMGIERIPWAKSPSLRPLRGRCPRGRQAWCQSPNFAKAPRMPPYASSAAREARAASGSAVAVVNTFRV